MQQLTYRLYGYMLSGAAAKEGAHTGQASYCREHGSAVLPIYAHLLGFLLCLHGQRLQQLVALLDPARNLCRLPQSRQLLCSMQSEHMKLASTPPRLAFPFRMPPNRQRYLHLGCPPLSAAPEGYLSRLAAVTPALSSSAHILQRRQGRYTGKTGSTIGTSKRAILTADLSAGCTP